jgi:hypothetical protein
MTWSNDSSWVPEPRLEQFEKQEHSHPYERDQKALAREGG